MYVHHGLDKRCGSITVIQEVLYERPGFHSGLVHSVHSQPPMEDRKSNEVLKTKANC